MGYDRLSRWLQESAPGLRRVPGMRMTGRSARYILDAAYRDECHLRLFRDRQLFQAAGHTWAGRYPNLFACLSDRLGDMEEPRILSFGCSTGEEVGMLRSALPKARITGMDISARNIRIARRRFADPRTSFLHGGRVEQTGGARFDAILCLAVLQRAELTIQRPADCSPWLTFDKVERAILDIDAHLRPGGLLALYHANFRLADTRVAARYTPVLCWRPHRDDRAKYGPDNRLLPLAADGHEILFVKMRD